MLISNKRYGTVDHNLLWAELFNAGISTKVIRIFKYIYEEANNINS